MENQPEWNPNHPAESLQKWTDFLHEEAVRQFKEAGTHVSVLFLLKEDQGIVSVNPVPPKTEHQDLNAAISEAISAHDLYGVIFIGESWTYFIKENDHTAFQLLDGEMNVSDLRDEDKKEALLVRAESRDGKRVLYLDEIVRSDSGISLGQSKRVAADQLCWFG